MWGKRRRESERKRIYFLVSDILCNTRQHCNTLQHTATHCNTLQHTATHCKEFTFSYLTFSSSYSCNVCVGCVGVWCECVGVWCVRVCACLCVQVCVCVCVCACLCVCMCVYKCVCAVELIYVRQCTIWIFKQKYTKTRIYPTPFLPSETTTDYCVINEGVLAERKSIAMGQ